MIYDDFSSRTDVSRTRRYKLRHQHEGICIYYAELGHEISLFELRGNSLPISVHHYQTGFNRVGA